MKKFILPLLIGIVVLACNKKDEDSDPVVTNADISGTYTGELELLTGGNSLGKEASIMYITNKSGNVYDLSSEAGGEAFAELTVSGTKFTGVEANGSGLSSLVGSLSGDDITITAVADDTTYKFIGSRPASGGGGGTVSITINGDTYKLIPQSNACETEDAIMGSYGTDGVSEDYSISFLFHSAMEAGTYSVVQTANSDSETTAQISDVNSGDTFEATGGTTTVSGTAGNFTVTLDNIVFDYNMNSQEKVTPISVKGTLTCE